MIEPEDIPADASTLIRLGTVSTVDLAQAKCVVRYGNPDDDDGAAETPPVRWLAGRAGKTRVWSPPSVGEQVLLLAPDGQFGNAVAITGIVQNSFPPAGSDETEVLEFGDGARISYDPASHALAAVLPAGGTAAIDAPGGLSIRGPVTIEGDVSITGKVDTTDRVTSEADVVGAGISLKDHKHGQVQPGGGQSGKPLP
ncbi:phage baseplate assembly protein V [Sphingomonas psychrotolerans]|uniref:Phage baseplate assembly protein V n=1 Tax=Sphingomonas psychrotolerans TaxID=1327635 RepID=A0ABU3N1J0_9SPHN|nr:phage baseplate assembly protein V [Sphingomonas psychrotolerans]MDT8758243.1 phage baseplate assembly protein V [Sphingomonas psychrotolerans]